MALSDQLVTKTARKYNKYIVLVSLYMITFTMLFVGVYLVDHHIKNNSELFKVSVYDDNTRCQIELIDYKFNITCNYYINGCYGSFVQLDNNSCIFYEDISNAGYIIGIILISTSILFLIGLCIFSITLCLSNKLLAE
jgi:hypothetical protein